MFLRSVVIQPLKRGVHKDLLTDQRHSYFDNFLSDASAVANSMVSLSSWLTVTRLPLNILSASATSRITRCDWPNFHFRALFG